MRSTSLIGASPALVKRQGSVWINFVFEPLSKCLPRLLGQESGVVSRVGDVRADPTAKGHETRVEAGHGASTRGRIRGDSAGSTDVPSGPTVRTTATRLSLSLACAL